MLKGVSLNVTNTGNLVVYNTANGAILWQNGASGVCGTSCTYALWMCVWEIISTNNVIDTPTSVTETLLAGPTLRTPGFGVPQPTT